jgi:hypothetical protein
MTVSLCGWQADLFCLQETQDRTYTSTFLPSFKATYNCYQSLPPGGKSVRSRGDLTRSTFAR